jgi:hypothetical protein
MKEIISLLLAKVYATLLNARVFKAGKKPSARIIFRNCSTSGLVWSKHSFKFSKCG